MAAIDDLIKQVEDGTLRTRLREELRRLTHEKKFGLVFEDHLPELVPLHTAEIQPGSLVSARRGPFAETWRVDRLGKKEAHCHRVRDGREQTFPLQDLVVVKQFGAPIFPSLTPVDKVSNGKPEDPWHVLIEAENYHALEMLRYLHQGQVDCIYIDPPYNTGARDWKYNNDYVDQNDRWRHSKWLAMMRRRLMLARDLLHPDKGVLVVTIDEHEVLHLGMLLETLFPTAARQLVTIVINQKGVAQGRLSRAEEYAFFVFMPNAFLPPAADDLLSPDDEGGRTQEPRWERLLRGGTNSRREDRQQLFFPIKVDPERKVILEFGDPLPLEKEPDPRTFNERTAWPLRTNGSFGNWRVSPPTLRKLHAQGYVKLGGFDKARKTWTILYLGEKAQREIAEGIIRVVSRDPTTGSVHVEYSVSQGRNVKTVWHRKLHDAGNYGSSLLRDILKGSGQFAFPKSLYAERDTIGAIVRDRPNALILDFFAGSGTTLNAVNLLNAADGGRRRCILVTNNEVSKEEADELATKGEAPGSPKWESHGIAQSVTWPRSKFTILGQRDDGSLLEGAYFTGRFSSVEKARKFRHVSVLRPEQLDLPARKQMASLIGLPQTALAETPDFIVTADHAVTVLLNENAASSWIAALEGQDHVTDLVVFAQKKATFDDIRARVEELLGPATVTEEEKRPMKDGFEANLEYFRLGFLEKDDVALKRRFAEILPLLWMRAGSVGPRPQAPRTSKQGYFLTKGNTFAVLFDEREFRDFRKQVNARQDVTHVYLVTDSEDAFQEMSSGLRVPTAIQLYRDYLENFMINRGDL